MTLQRLGRLCDGGYVLDVETIQTIKECYTYGVGEDISFEHELVSINQDVLVHIHDPIPFEGVLPERTTFHQEKLGSKRNTGLLKIDVEGDEYDYFLGSPDLSGVECLIVEFHFVDVKMFVLHIVLGQLSMSFDVIHVHGNNCTPMANDLPTTLEMTFKRRKQKSYPIVGLDFPNCLSKPDLSFVW